MKLIYQKFICPECGQIRWLKSLNICINCRDKLILEKLAQVRKMNRSQTVFA